jgi:hypothetical protein
LNIPVLASVPRHYNGSNGNGNGRKSQDHSNGSGSAVDEYVQQR